MVSDYHKPPSPKVRNPLDFGEVPIPSYLREMMEEVQQTPPHMVSESRKMVYGKRFADKTVFELSLRQKLTLILANPNVIHHLSCEPHRFRGYITALWVMAINTAPRSIYKLGKDQDAYNNLLKQDKESVISQLLSLAIKLDYSVIHSVYDHWENGISELRKVLNQERCMEAIRYHPKLYNFIPPEFKTLELYMEYKCFNEKFRKAINDGISKAKSINLSGVRKLHLLDPKIKFGVELEYIGKHNRRKEIAELLTPILGKNRISVSKPHISSDFKGWVFTSDCSWPNMGEFVTPIINSSAKLRTMIRAIDMLNTLRENDSIRLNHACGLHVHIDAAHLSFKEVSLLNEVYRMHLANINKLVSQHRIHCPHALPPLPIDPEDEEDIRSSEMWKYFAFSTHSYFKYKTVEFRIHESTTNYEEVLYWVHFAQQFVKNGLKNLKRSYFLDSFFDSFDMAPDARRFYKKKFIENMV